MTQSKTPLMPRIVVGVDGSSSAKQALAWAHFLARTTGSLLEVVTVWQNPSSWTGVTDDWDPVVEAQALLSASCAEVLGNDQPSGLRLTVREGPTAAALISVAAGARMLVLGSRGHGGFAGLLLGSVSATCAEHAACPTLIIHGDQPPPAVTPLSPPRVHGAHHSDEDGSHVIASVGRPTRKSAKEGTA
ncbi:hypothetical protein GCM10022221_76890 [Actinocorallia aurea]